jgi:phospholipase C
MRILLCAIAILSAFSTVAGATVQVSGPWAGSTVSSPVHYVATATAPNCARGVASMGIYVNNKLTYVVKGTHLDTEIALPAGAQHTVVEEWDWCGAATFTTINLDVAMAVKPTVSVAASPATIEAAESSSLSVLASHATEVTLTGSDGSSYTLGGEGGTQEVSPSATTTYTATAIGADATSSAAVTLRVQTAPTVTLSASPDVINAGGSSTLTVAAGNASKVTLSGSNGSVYTFGSTGGT